MNIPASLRRLAIQRATDRCEYCSIAQAGQVATFHIDHIIPIVANGETIAENLALACVSCSLKKRIYNETQESFNLSVPCPVCGMVSLHHWHQIGATIDRVFEGQKFIANSALWQWCSNCHSFEHYSSFVPDWWACDLKVDVDKLTTLPIAIEEARLASLKSIEK